MKIVKHLLHTLFAFFMLYMLTRTLMHPHENYYNSPDLYIYSKGNTTAAERSKIVSQLNKFQDGYTKRDTSQIKSFMNELFSKDNLLVLGTMPNEILKNHNSASRLVKADWRRWGDCTFLINNSNISVSGNVAWISTIGYVKFDLSSLLVLPLRLSAVMIKEADTWKFQMMQFQFDLDLTNVLVTIVLMIIWTIFSVVLLIIVIAKSLKNYRKQISKNI